MNINYFDSLPDEAAPLTNNVTAPLVYGIPTTPNMSYNFYSTNNILVSNTADIATSTNACQASSTTRTPSQLYMMGGTDVLTSHITTPQVTVGVRPFETSTDALFHDVKKCHLHTKPQLTCKFCRKFKSSIHQHARLAQQQQQEGRWTELQDLESTVWATIEMTNQTTYNVSTLLRENILASEYFKSLYGLQTFKEVVDEIFNYADHAEPYCAGSTRAPSTLFCCLYKLFTMRLKEHEVQALLDHTDSPYLRCCGFLYLRFVLPPEKLWDWLSPYFLDDEVFSPGTDKTRTTTIGEYVESLITEDRYFSIVLPRIPVKIKAQDGAQLITMPSHRKRKALNKSKIDQFKPNTPVAACSNGEWLEGRVLSIDGAESGQCSCLVQLDDDVVDLVDLGLVIILDAKQRALKRREERRLKRLSRGLPPFVKKKKYKTHTSPLQTHRTTSSEKSKESTHHNTHPKRRRHDHGITSSRSRPTDSRHRTFRSPSSSRNRHSSTAAGTSLNAQSNMIEEFRKRERAKALAFGKDYARRPTSYKSSLSLRFENFSGRKRTQLPPQVFKDAPAPNLSRAEPSREEVKKREEPSLDYQKRMAQLVERYSKMHD